MALPGLSYKIDKINGISVYQPINGEQRIDACQIVITGQKLDIVKKHPGITVTELSQKLDPALPCSVNLTGKNVIIRKTDRLDRMDHDVFASIFPNTSFDDFYVQTFTSGQTTFIAAIRKKDADAYFALLTQAGFTPLLLSLGPFVFDTVANQINNYDQNVVFGGHHIGRNEDKHWISYRFDDNKRATYPIKIANEKLDEDLVLAYAAAFQLSLSDESYLIRTNADGVNARLKSKLIRENFKLQAFAILMVFFIILLANFLSLMSLNKGNEQLGARVNLDIKNNLDLKVVNDEVIRKEQLVDSLGWEGGRRKSIMIDQTVALMPPGITVYDISIDPAYQPSGSRQPDKTSFLNRQLLIRGSADAIIPVNEWIARMKSMKWVTTVDLSTYNFNHELNTGVFTIILNY